MVNSGSLPKPLGAKAQQLLSVDMLVLCLLVAYIVFASILLIPERKSWLVGLSSKNSALIHRVVTSLTLPASTWKVSSFLSREYRRVRFPTATPPKCAFDVTFIGQRSSLWPRRLSERRDRISPRVQALFFLCTIYVSANAMNEVSRLTIELVAALFCEVTAFSCLTGNLPVRLVKLPFFLV